MVINDVFDFFKIEVGKFKLDFDFFDLCEELGNIMKLLVLCVYD